MLKKILIAFVVFTVLLVIACIVVSSIWFSHEEIVRLELSGKEGAEWLQFPLLKTADHCVFVEEVSGLQGYLLYGKASFSSSRFVDLQLDSHFSIQMHYLPSPTSEEWWELDKDTKGFEFKTERFSCWFDEENLHLYFMNLY